MDARRICNISIRRNILPHVHAHGSVRGWRRRGPALPALLKSLASAEVGPSNWWRCSVNILPHVHAHGSVGGRRKRGPAFPAPWRRNSMRRTIIRFNLTAVDSKVSSSSSSSDSNIDAHIPAASIFCNKNFQKWNLLPKVTRFEAKRTASKCFCSKRGETTFETTDTMGFLQNFASKIHFWKQKNFLTNWYKVV